jgi:2'-5' RNA ligase
MTMDETGSRRAGETALIVKVPDLEPLIGTCRQSCGISADVGRPAHVTVLYPFLDLKVINASILDALEELASKQQAFDVKFQQCGSFPGVLFLAPTPAGPLRALTNAALSRWPEILPYEGRHTEIVPHLTIAQNSDVHLLAKLQAQLEKNLPISAHISSLQLMVCDGERYHEHTSFVLHR